MLTHDGVIVSIIIIYQHHSTQLNECIKSVMDSCRFANLSQDQFEIIPSNIPNKSRARNDACRRATGKILVFIDSDARATDFWIHELLKPFSNPRFNAGCVGGPNILGSFATHREVLADRLLTSNIATWKSSSRYKVTGKQRIVDESELTSCNLAVSRTAFWKAGGFPLDCIPCEENVLLNRIQENGSLLIYNPLAIVIHNRAPLLKPHLQKIFYYATGRGLMIKRGQGGIKMFPKLSLDYIYLGVGLVLHYIVYVAGLIWGLLKK